MCIIDCLSTIVFIFPLYLDDTKVIILILWWRTFQLVSTLWRVWRIGNCPFKIPFIYQVIDKSISVFRMVCHTYMHKNLKAKTSFCLSDKCFPVSELVSKLATVLGRLNVIHTNELSVPYSGSGSPTILHASTIRFTSVP